MSKGGHRFAFAAALCATVACSLTTDLTGLVADHSSDAAPGTDASGLDAPADVAIDAAGPDAAPPPCAPETVIDTPLTSTLGSWSPRSFQNDSYPKVESFFGTPAAVLFPFVDTTPIPIDAGDPDAGPTFFQPPERINGIGSLWQPKTVALRSFDVELEIFVKCTSASSCADGFGFAWLDTTLLSPLTTLNSGGVMGLPTGVSGGAVLADTYKNDTTETTDPTVPALEIVQLDGARTLGHYPWVVASRSVGFLGAWHKLSISVRASAVTVRYDGSAPIAGVVPSIARGLVTIGAGTGGLTDAVAVRNVKGSFYACTP